MSRLPAFVLACWCFASLAQDSAYARSLVRELTSEKCYGRGYVRGGLDHAAAIILREVRKAAAEPVFGGKYEQPFAHAVNTFPAACRVSVNGRRLKAGTDFIPDAASGPARGTYLIRKKDSVTYESEGLRVQVRRKLTFGASTSQTKGCTLYVQAPAVEIRDGARLKVRLRARHVAKFTSRNIACSVRGQRDDSMVVFSAHYDHLGGLGREAWFPGANDNAGGVAMVLDMLRHATSNRPKFTTVFIFFAAEEAGLLGSKYFVGSRALALDRIRFLVNLDLVGTGDDGIMAVNGSVFEREFELLERLNREGGYLKQVRKRGKAANSDHYWFTEAGVRGFFIYTMGGIAAYHDVFDVERTLPLSEYNDLFALLLRFTAGI